MSESPETLPLSLLERLAQQFEWYARNVYGAGPGGPASAAASPLYAALASAIAQDPAVLALAVHADHSQPLPNLLLGAVHYLLLSGASPELAEYYPSLTDRPQPSSDVYPLFRQFALDHSATIRDLVSTRRVQTNEVGRCGCLLPAFGVVFQRGGEKPLALIEIGASAGLNLVWERYSYDYGPAGRIGDPDSPVQLACAPQGSRTPPLPPTLPKVVYRAGIDLAPVDLYNEDAVRWLRALIWPEHTARAALLYHAVQVARQSPPRLLAGDAAELLLPTLQSAPEGVTLCVFHSFTLYQFSSEARSRLNNLLTDFSRQRRLFRVALEWYEDRPRTQLELSTYHAGAEERELLAYCESHGRAIEWIK